MIFQDSEIEIGAIRLISDLKELDGTQYFEFLPGKYRDRCWNEISVFVPEDVFTLLEPSIARRVTAFDHFSFIALSRSKVRLIAEDFILIHAGIQSCPDKATLAEILGIDPASPTLAALPWPCGRGPFAELIADLAMWLNRTSQTHAEIALLGI